MVYSNIVSVEVHIFFVVTLYVKSSVVDQCNFISDINLQNTNFTVHSKLCLR